MEAIYLLAALWFFAAVLSTILANRLKISIALMEIIVGSLVGYAASELHLADSLALHADWMKFCTGLGAILLTFLAGAELNPDAMKSKLREVSIIGLIGFAAPFIGCTLIAYVLIGWTLQASLLCGIPSPRPPWPWFTRSCWNTASIRPISAREFWAPVSLTIWARLSHWD
jgi:Kef-type K+ transport system membrane component KefB